MTVACLIPNELLGPTSHLVLDTIRVGFPTARLHFYVNLTPDQDRVSKPMAHAGQVADEVSVVCMSHSEWLLDLLFGEGMTNDDEPLVIVDSDVIFYDTVQGWDSERILSGFPVPSYYSDLTDCLHMFRLHTSLLWVRSPRELHNYLRRQRAALKLVPALEQYMPSNLIDPELLYLNQCPIFYDVGSKLCHAVPCQPFSEVLLDRYSHITSGSCYHDVKTMFTDPEQRRTFEGMHTAALQHPHALQGMWRGQMNYYQERAMPLARYLAAYPTRRTAAA